jgi:hypothetical protein
MSLKCGQRRPANESSGKRLESEKSVVEVSFSKTLQARASTAYGVKTCISVDLNFCCTYPEMLHAHIPFIPRLDADVLRRV